MNPDITLTEADIEQLDELVTLENRCFDTDRLSRRNFRNMIRSESADVVVLMQGNVIAGYAIILFHKGTSLARLYSIAINPDLHGQGYARILVEESEKRARRHQCIFMRLEAKVDNFRAIRLYENLGYTKFGVYPDYYEDHRDALRFQKRIKFVDVSANTLEIPYVRQTTEFTCGPAALMMAMNAIQPAYQPSVSEELQIWREATTIYMTSGHGGCSPYGLALAAFRRGFEAEVSVTQSGPLFTEGVRKAQKKKVLCQVHQDFMAEIAQAGISVTQTPLSQHQIEVALERKEVPIILISTYHFDKKKAPHWVVISAIDANFIYIHDPDVDEEQHRLPFDSQYLPLPRAQFDRMSQFGQQRLRAGLIISQAPH
jgi:ribosomal protein S18 acetylase RimI-like enzyme